MLTPDGRMILISGANRGIGRAVAQRLYEAGYALSLGGRDLDALTELSAAWEPGRIHIARYDAQDWASHRPWVDAAVARFGRIDGLVNNAGMHSTMTLRAPNEAELDAIWAVNCKGPLNLIHHALPHLEASGTGRIVNIASMSGKRVRNDNIAYNMTKHAMIALTHAARRISWDKGVRATALCPSFVPTDMTAASNAMPREDMTQPADLAELVATVLALPNNASVAEVLVNCRLEDML
ncbi:SDR family NAD(P)-dependent oxidoreductase [Bosea sp. PAMC 26642]|uniref:SDR family NAD(P)-dependent oxidoreductase n=1 Tax=Bosea sp. (strain PAMC 26642) TaxID=1792307 RepID=UPI0007705A6E|nr:SDR family NAD(P)-dependent oxidoreductase [Bosea sp. PAMC 26642]AMJ59799.1 short-chain dehydrogenase [Bosea sp. PAMC 26642]